MWCGQGGPGVTFDRSHVLPECLGNFEAQVLPAGFVCKPCNGYFGTKVEPALLRDPVFHTLGVVLQLTDPDDGKAFRDRLFDTDHPRIGTAHRSLNLNPRREGEDSLVDVTYTIQGTMRRPDDGRTQALISRAIHKMAFESLAWAVHFKDGVDFVDVLDPAFDPVRRWVREGQPQRPVRPVVWRPGAVTDHRWETVTWHYEGRRHWGVELRLFWPWFGVSLTSEAAVAGSHLEQWSGMRDGRQWFVR